MRRPARVLVAVVLLVLVVIVVGIAVAPRGYAQGGPLANDVETTVDALLPAGGDGTWGITLRAPEGTEPAILESVTPAVEPTGLTILRISTTDVVGDTALGAASVYPPPVMVLHDVAGTEVPPASTGERVQVIIGIHYPGPEQGRIDEIRLRYTVGDRQYETILHASYHVTPLE